MRFVSQRPKAALCLAFAVGWASAWLAIPLKKELLIRAGEGRYSDLAARCDSAMREQFVAKTRIDSLPPAEAARELAAADLGLVDCQDYDLFQKRLIQLGLSENELALLRLRAFETGGLPLLEVIREHEVRF